MLRSAYILVLTAFVFLVSPVAAQQNGPKPLLIPIGGGSLGIYADVTRAAIAHSGQADINILILPSALASNSDKISDEERERILSTAEYHRRLFQESCESLAPNPFRCRVFVVPVITRPDAYDQNNFGAFELDLSAIVILDGDQKIGSETINGTPIELLMSQEYERGIPVAGIGAGALNLSNAMIAGYQEQYTASDALNFGSVDLWYSAARHGLLFGSRHAILDERFYQDGNIARLLNAIALPEAPHVGVGIDSNTSVHLSDGVRLANVSGQSIVTILDAETYHSAMGARYKGKNNTLSLRNIIFNTVASGNSAYDLQRRQHSLRYPYPRLIRTFDSLATPPGAGALIVAGGLAEALPDNPILKRFVGLSGGEKARILVIASGFPSQTAANQAAESYASALGVTTQTLAVSSDHSAPIVIPEAYTGVLVIASDPSSMDQRVLSPVRDAWLSGTPLMVDNAASALVGNAYYDIAKLANMGDETDQPERFWGIQDPSDIQTGLNLVDINITPQIMADNNWASWMSLAYNQPEMLSLGISENTAVELSPTRAISIGEKPVFILDLRDATLDTGLNKEAVIANGLLDVFTPREIIEPVIADTDSIPEAAPTPIIHTPTITPLPTSTLTPSPTLTPTTVPTETPAPTQRIKATPTPLIIPPPSDPGTRATMVSLGVFIVLVIVAGIWINRRRIF